MMVMTSSMNSKDVIDMATFLSWSRLQDNAHSERVYTVKKKIAVRIYSILLATQLHSKVL